MKPLRIISQSQGKRGNTVAFDFGGKGRAYLATVRDGAVIDVAWATKYEINYMEAGEKRSSIEQALLAALAQEVGRE